jgi:hypothetical protein
MALPLRHLICVLLLGLTATRLSAQPAEPLAPPVRSTVVRFYYHAIADPAQGPSEPALRAFLKNQKSRFTLNVATHGYTEPMTYLGEGPLELYKETKNEKGTERKIVATIPLPPGLKGVLYIMTFSEGVYHFLPLPYSGDGMPTKQAKLINLCPESLAVKVGASQALVPARGEALLDATIAGLVLPITVARQVEGGWQMQVETTVPNLGAEDRPLFLLVPDSPAFNRVQLMQMGAMPVTAPSEAAAK